MADYMRELDKVKVQVFTGSNSAFYGSLMSGLNVEIVEDLPCIAGVNIPKLHMCIRPDFFELPIKTQVGIFVHEINHVARLHQIRQNGRDKEYWNIACDYEINNTLVKEGYTFEGAGGLFNKDYDGMSAEEIYDIIYDKQENDDSNGKSNFDSHEFECDSEDGSQTAGSVAAVMDVLERAMQAERIAGEQRDWGNGSSVVDKLLEKFKNPLLDWRTLLRKYFTDMVKSHYSFARPNRRHQDIYLPSMVNEESNLASVSFYMDCSASVSEEELETMLSEFAHIKRTFNPDIMSLVQFDTRILREDVFRANQRIKGIEFVMGGGTCLECVRSHIERTKPKVAVIMSDLWCEPMEPVKGTDLIWIIVNNPRAEVIKGKKAHIEV